MKSFLKDAGSAFYISIIALALALVAWIVLIISNAVVGYPLQNGGMAIALGVIALIAMALGLLLSVKGGGALSDVLVFVSFVLIAVAMALTLAGRVELASGLFTWDPNNELGWNAFNTAVTSIAIYCVAEVALIVSAFLPEKK